MKKVLNIVICSMLIFTFVCCGTVGYADSVAAEKITLDINFDKTEYAVGETAVATVSVTNIPESIIGKKFGAFQLYIKFDKDVLEYKTGEFKLGLDEEENLNNNSGSINPHQSQGIIVALCTPQTETYTFSEVTEPIEILTVSFNVVAATRTAEPIVSFGDESVGYTAIFVDGKNDGYNEIDCEYVKQSVSATTKYEYLLENQTAGFEDETITAKVVADILTGRTAYLFIGLFDKRTDSLVKPAKMFVVGETNPQIYSTTFEGITSTDNLEVRYFLWKSLLNITPAFEVLKYDFSVSTKGGDA